MPQAPESESRTRQTRIDPRLTAVGWKAAPTCEQPEARKLATSAVPELPTTAGPADYEVGPHRLETTQCPQHGRLEPQAD